MDISEGNKLTLIASIVVLGMSSPWVGLTFAFPVGSSALCARNVLFSEETFRVNWRVQNAHEHAQRTSVQNISTRVDIRLNPLLLIEVLAHRTGDIQESTTNTSIATAQMEKMIKIPNSISAGYG